MRWGNCWLYALPKWFKNYFKGFWLSIRKSKNSWVPHVVVSKNLNGVEVEEYVPCDPVVPTKWWHHLALHTLIFKGRVRKGPAKEIT